MILKGVHDKISTTTLSATHLRRILVSGKVQGVCYRKHTKKTATRLGITGWVRNQPDGSVEILGEGTVEQLNKLERWCQKGSPNAKVVKVVSLAVKSEGDVEKDASGRVPIESADSTVPKESNYRKNAPTRHFMEFNIVR
ncbi:unnamed protein product [Phytomonas sp. Hart1]|nr:unnamed protein product [Phytomonas sp. Hart1]|eukprot:CCW70992.1 unnamed protein product [Phytomonas sp. isolate Hart1]